jgi:hypothetical protein
VKVSRIGVIGRHAASLLIRSHDSLTANAGRTLKASRCSLPRSKPVADFTPGPSTSETSAAAGRRRAQRRPSTGSSLNRLSSSLKSA